jgi:hypothetical protein
MLRNTVTILIIAAVLSVVLCANCTEAQGKQRANIDRKWRQVEAWQEWQDMKLKAIELEADRLDRKTDGAKGVKRFAPTKERQ